MRVAHTIASLDPCHGGPSRSVPALAAALCEHGVQAAIHVWEEDDSLERRPDLVHDHGMWLYTNHRAARLAHRLGTPRVVSARGMLLPGALRHHRWRKRLAWLLFQHRDLATASLIHVTSAAEADSVRRSGLRTPLALIPNGTALPDPLPPRRRGDVRRVLFLSRLHPTKGVPLLIRSWAGLQRRGWELVIAGPGAAGHRREVEAMIAALDLGRDVQIMGSVSDAHKWALLRSADIFVLPTLSENFGLVVAEALAAEVPVITTKAAPWPDLETHDCGWWTDVTEAAFAGALREAMALTDEKRRSMGAKGRRLVEQAFSWGRVAEDMLAAYNWVLYGESLPDCVLLDPHS